MTAFAEQLLSRQTNKPGTLNAENSASALVERPVDRLAITEAAKRTGISRDTIYRLYKAGFVKGWMPGPKKVLIDANDLGDFLVVSASPGFWPPERRARYNRPRYNGKVVG